MRTGLALSVLGAAAGAVASRRSGQSGAGRTGAGAANGSRSPSLSPSTYPAKARALADLAITRARDLTDRS